MTDDELKMHRLAVVLFAILASEYMLGGVSEANYRDACREVEKAGMGHIIVGRADG